MDFRESVNYVFPSNVEYSKETVSGSCGESPAVRVERNACDIICIRKASMSQYLEG